MSSPSLPSAFDERILTELRRRAPSVPGKSDAGTQVQLPQLVEQYLDRSGLVLDASLPYESRPGAARRLNFGGDDEAARRAIAMIVHAVQQGTEHKITYCSGFALSAPGSTDGQSVFVTCAHTLEEIRYSPVLRPSSSPPSSAGTLGPSGSFIVSGTPPFPTFSPVASVLSALHRSDLLLLSTPALAPPVPTLPVSPYPAQPGAAIRAHFVTDKLPVHGKDAEGWQPWLGGTWSKWVRGTVMGYKDLAGREAKPGTYDALSHLLFDPPPTPGSSGGPIIDEESGAVVGVMLGTQMQSSLEGVRGWGVPSEIIFEMFSLPGLKLKKQS